MSALAQCFALPALAALDRPAARLVHASRVWVALARRRQCPRPCLARLLGPAAPGFRHFMERLVAAWPDPFAAFPPCATHLSPDEATLAALFEAALTGDDGRAEVLLADFLGPDERRRLWEAALPVCNVLAGEA